MDIKLITSDLEKTRFLNQYNELAGMKVPINYVLECQVYGTFIDGKMVGGFAFACGEDMAWPQVLPDANKIFEGVPKNFCLEINLVWATGPLHNSYKKMIQFWGLIAKKAASFDNVEYITYAVDVRRKYLVAMYERLSCGKLYEGEVPKYPGRKAVVYYTSPMRCRLAKVICFKEYLIRFKRYIKRSAAIIEGSTRTISESKEPCRQANLKLTDQLSAG